MKVDTVRMMTMAALMAAAMSTTAFAGSWRTDGIRTMMEAVRRTDGSGSTATMTDIRNASILIPTGMC